jgi:hypothetical protein
MIRILAIVAVLYCLIACDKNEPAPAQKVYFKLNVGDYPIDNAQDWVIIHDKDGNVIDTKKFGKGETLVFDTIADIKEFAVTLLKAYDPTGLGTTRYQLQSYYPEKSGAEWTLKKLFYLIDDPGTLKGELSIQVSGENLGSPWRASASNRQSAYYPAQGTLSGFEFQNIEIGSNWNDYFVSLVDTQGTSYYKFLENVQPGSMELSLDDCKPFDKTTKVTFPRGLTASLQVLAYHQVQKKEEQGFLIQSYNNFTDTADPASFDLSYLERFTYYWIKFSAFYEGYSTNFESKGIFPNAVKFTSLDTKLANASFNNFELSGSSKFIRRYTWWQFANSTNHIIWTVQTSKNNFKNLTLPAIIRQKYPSLDPAILEHNHTSLWEEGPSMENILEDEFKKGSLPDDYVSVVKTLY